MLVIAAITTPPCLTSVGSQWNENFATLSCASFGTKSPENSCFTIKCNLVLIHLCLNCGDFVEYYNDFRKV
ncbi:hypothetical protein L1987_65185 [Smallanthus sonchifolius]|uniref:Uncharacterized protein n=1 Tax=Smallanthus sonchifolius TaxID=185202 RepID=A0ACB9BTT6_9ASTR|nr:hypothetical protein L1987_65185 [Smallanthus sonchifolius]